MKVYVVSYHYGINQDQYNIEGVYAKWEDADKMREALERISIYSDVRVTWMEVA